MATNINWGMNGTFKTKSAAQWEKMKELQAATDMVKTVAIDGEAGPGEALKQAILGSNKVDNDFFLVEKKYMEGLKAKADLETPKEVFDRYKASECLVYYPRHQRGGDYSDNTINPGELEYTNVKSLLARFFITCHSNNGRVPNWRDFCIGVISCSWSHRGELHMPMFDYDGKNIKTHVKKQVKALQEKYGLGDAWIYRTRRGLHVYFFTDLVSRNEYMEMLAESECCKGFRRATENHGWGTLRVSAKFTKFDISLEYILRSKKRHSRRMVRKAHLVQELIRLGQECGTHFASLFPQWAGFDEDPTEWKQGARPKKGMTRGGKRGSFGRMYDGNQYKGKKIKKVSAPALSFDGSINIAVDPAADNVEIKSGATWTATTTTTTTSTNNW